MVNSKLKKIGLSGAIFVTLTMILVCSYLVYLDAKPVHDYFSPKTSAGVNVENEAGEWSSLKFEGQDFIKFDSAFWDKEIVNDANSDGNAQLRVKDDKGNIVIDEFQVSPGTSKQLSSLKNDKQYFFEIKTASKGQFTINAI
ncbi:hypothetical protein ACE41H_21530 [Paenibacillus enshidis]|uniref:Uncharacterized protein n=1 Tax=Paenibacillus enshidis TaxID=1458439 RepID=A0ABV5AYP6_9BACL